MASEFSGVGTLRTPIKSFFYPGLVLSIILLAGGLFGSPAEAQAENGVFFGWVYDGAMRPLGAVIRVQGSGIPDIRSDPRTGKYRGELPPGKYTISVQAAGYLSQQKKIRVKSGRESRADFQLALDRKEESSIQAGTFTGTVTDRGGRPLAAVLSFPGSGITAVSTNPETGTFRKDLPPGKYRVSVRAQGYKPRAKKVKIAAEKEKRLSFRLSPEKAKPAPPGAVDLNAPELDTMRLPPPPRGKVAAIESRISGEVKLVNSFISQMGQDLVKLETDLYLLRERLFEAVPVGSTFKIILGNELGGIFDIQNVQIEIDDKQVLNRQDEGDDLDSREEYTLYWEGISPGPHQISVFISVRGKAKSFMNYFKNYAFELKSSRRISIPEGNGVSLRVRCLDRGGRYDLQDRLHLDLETVEPESGKE